MTEYTQAELLPTRHLNRGLFADYYLDTVVPTLPLWDDLSACESAKTAFAALKKLRAEVNPAALDEAQLEEQWIKPVFNALDHHYAVQVKLRYRERGHRKPDYLLMAHADHARALTAEVYAPKDLAHALAVADAKRWGVKLDQTSAEDKRNPSQQIDEYLRYSEVTWGVLTDGRYWRLYHRDTSKYNRYYAVDLDALLDGDDLHRFLYFYLFFRREAFTDGWLDQVLRGSADFAQRLTDTLEDEVYDALEMIAQGFLDYRRNRLSADPATLRTIYEKSLVLLYRLLFIFYAESREILPLFENREYTDRVSLTAIKKAAALALDLRRPLDADGSETYTRLRDLFFAIDSGNTRYDLPPYNGHLFSDLDHTFIAEKVVGDSHIIPALDKLARVGHNGERVFVDYRDLDVRHLGSIYEKLLEYDLAIATEDLTLRGGQYAPAKAGDAIVKKTGQVYLRTGSNERKVTGSYYTPDYIVRFIVEKTLEPLLTAITARYQQIDADGTPIIPEEKQPDFIREVLALNVLDPATGSGHFVVDATAYIAEWLRGLGVRSADMGDEDELIYWKRQVASACIYAVDINPLAVELAKLSMWLTTLAKGKPLSFLDHHIKLGNSLVGTDITALDDEVLSPKEEEKRRKKREKQRQQEQAVGQLNMFSDDDFTEGVRFAVAQMAQIETTIADHVADVKRQEALYAALNKRLAAWKQAADVWTARYFGLEVTPDDWKAVREFSAKGDLPPKFAPLIERSGAISAEQRFFHWQLAFPEIFFDAAGQRKPDAGFDAVIGNPPYVRMEQIKPLKPFLQLHYKVHESRADLFLYFYERGIQFLKPSHRLGYITSGTYMNSNSARPFRQFIHDKAGFEWVANFGENQPFRGAEMVYPTIAVVKSGDKSETFRNLFMEGNVPFMALEETFENSEWVESLSEATGMEEWRFQPAELTRLFRKITQGNTDLQTVVDGQLFAGVKTGLNEAFIIDEATRKKLIQSDPKSSDLIKPMVRGQDLRPWHQHQTQYLIFVSRGVVIEEYAPIYEHLKKYEASLRARATVDSHEWYELQQPQMGIYSHFSNPKILWPDIAKLPRFSWDQSGLYLNEKCFIIVPNTSQNALLSVLNSRISWFILSQLATPLRLRGGLWQYQSKIQFVERLPIPALSAEQESRLATLAEQITALARERYALHESTRQTIVNEFGAGQSLSTRVTLYEWWTLENEVALNHEIQRQFGAEIPLKKREEWRGYLADQTAQHQALTAQISALETTLNATVYDAFSLDAAERGLIESTTKYPYGAV